MLGLYTSGLRPAKSRFEHAHALQSICNTKAGSIHSNAWNTCRIHSFMQPLLYFSTYGTSNMRFVPEPGCCIVIWCCTDAAACSEHTRVSVVQTVWSTFAAVPWAEPLPQLVQAIAGKQRQHSLQLVSQAYSSIQPDKLAALTGTSSADVLQRTYPASHLCMLHAQVLAFAENPFTTCTKAHVGLACSC